MIDFLAANWLWLAAFALMVFMHLGGHGCGAHGRRSHRAADDAAHHVPGQAESPPQTDPRTPENADTPSPARAHPRNR
jgi:hypothetical protein